MDGKSALGAPPSLRELCDSQRIALFLDFDGTLIDIAATPDGIDLPARLGDRLFALSERLGGRLALVSGRSISNLQDHIGSLRVARAGSHGAARQRADGSLIGQEPTGLPQAVYDALRDFSAEQGFEMESKAHGAALHFRSNPSLEKTGLEFAEQVAHSHELAIKRGKCVIELVRPGADKGGAVRAFMEEQPFVGALPIFIGDDVTDEDGFSGVADKGGFGIIVGDREKTLARYRLSNPEKVHEWLEL
ncbi:trehalose-phosphatase [Altericroceibacterium endophyticum]|uniref:Trehalose 6-phosphate phosphatase n=1 Tax=Altericroceibacterium endophyticum TaxID=1808508 RepID=A0A6I4T490_9SPHN|nr:trehalose-phosphatase [Altericroceibacterium endophyticum]MXO64780.1 trehalose-phosphatase [Altericroceibacterium endophyticum]